MEFYDLVKQWMRSDQKTGKALTKEGEKGRYSIVTLDLTVATSNQMMELSGNFISIENITGNGTCILKLDTRHSAELNLRKIQEIGAPFGKLFFTTDGAGGSCDIVIGGELFSRFKPSSSANVGVKNNAGNIIDPATSTLQTAIEALITAGNVDLAALEVLLGTIDADTGAIKTAIEILDDWDESDRCKVNLPKQDTATNTKVSVGSSDTTVLAANATRQFAVFVNDSDEVIYLSLSATAVMNEGIRLNASGGAYEINQTNLYTGEVSAICASGTKNITVSSG